VGWQNNKTPKGNAIMTSLVTPLTARSLTAVALASALIVLTAAPSVAQMSSGNADDALAHTVNPNSNGQCWIPTDSASAERGYGYMGSCSGSAANEAGNAHAHAAHPHHPAKH
jgi:hypothetical protein